MLERKQSSENTRRLASNTLMLSILSFSGYFLALATLPYQSRVLGPETFGMISFAMAFGLYFQILIDFGFTLSATEQVSKHRDDIHRISKILSTVMLNKLLLATASLFILFALCLFIDPFKSDPLLYTLFVLSYIFVAITPDYFYRGTENMKSITIRTVIIRSVSIALIFVLLSSADDYYIVPILLALGNLGALTYSAWDIHRRGVRFSRPSFKEFTDSLRQSSLFFYSRVATNIYSASNTFILGLIYGPASGIVGFFTSADKLTSAAKFSLSPLVDSLYPHMVRNQDYRLIKKIILIFTPLILAISAVVWLLAYDISAFIFGEDFRGAGEYLRWLIPTAIIAFPSMVLGYPTLSPMGLAKMANMSVILGSILQIFMLTALLTTSALNVVSICIITIITEFSVLAIRIFSIMRYRQNRNTDKSSDSIR